MYLYKYECACNVVEGAVEINKYVFLSNCYVSEIVICNMQMFPHDYEYFAYENIYFFTHSAIEHFYY